MMILIEGVLSAVQVAGIRRATDAGDWCQGSSTAGTAARQVKRNHQLDAVGEAARTVGEQVLHWLSAEPRFMARALPARIHPPLFNRHSVGEAYGDHIDSALMALPGQGLSLRTDLSATLFLSEPDDYDGGELQVCEGIDRRSVKGQAGDLVLYPSGAVHQVTPVTRGTRHACVLWIQSVVRDARQRELLLELDACAQMQGVQAGAPDALTLRLNGLYHNLLRLWAQP